MTLADLLSKLLPFVRKQSCWRSLRTTLLWLIAGYSTALRVVLAVALINDQRRALFTISDQIETEAP
jgi:hypothetical protein